MSGRGLEEAPVHTPAGSAGFRRVVLKLSGEALMGTRDHGIDGLINLFGIESPGLTSSLAIADYVSELAGA